MVPAIEDGGEWVESHVGSLCSGVRASGSNFGGNANLSEGTLLAALGILWHQNWEFYQARGRG